MRSSSALKLVSIRGFLSSGCRASAWQNSLRISCPASSSGLHFTCISVGITNQSSESGGRTPQVLVESAKRPVRRAGFAEFHVLWRFAFRTFVREAGYRESAAPIGFFEQDFPAGAYLHHAARFEARRFVEASVGFAPFHLRAHGATEPPPGAQHGRGSVRMRTLFPVWLMRIVGAPECALGFGTVLLSLAESRCAFGDLGWRVFLRHARGQFTKESELFKPAPSTLAPACAIAFWANAHLGCDAPHTAAHINYLEWPLVSSKERHKRLLADGVLNYFVYFASLKYPAFHFR